MSLKPSQTQAESDGRAIVSALVERSNRLGADPRNTNYAGGNTSAKGWAIDPVTGEPVELLWVKGSGGDLGTLTERGLAVLRLDRLRSLVEVYPGVEREDEMVGALDYCLFGPGGAAPSIDTAMHGLIDADHVDHLHPDSGIAFATAADGPDLTRRCFGDRVAWVDWRRPGFELALDLAEIRFPSWASGDPRRPRIGLGRHVRECEGSLEIAAAETFIAGTASRSVRACRRRIRPAHETERRARAASCSR
jgi:rhamnose utilization protein RhaD (predicted bifunctional aldolase and dehydrogenase)